MSVVYLSLGSNLGYRKRNLKKAVILIQERVGMVLRQSSYYDTAPWGFVSSHRFVNICVCVETQLSPRKLLEMTQQIERELGRVKKSVEGVYHDRLIDIDILLYDDLQLDEPDLKIPHPLMNERDFVMIPLREIRQ